jgi:hypothetical protein
MSFLTFFLVVSIANLALGYAAFFALRYAVRAAGGCSPLERWLPAPRTGPRIS